MPSDRGHRIPYIISSTKRDMGFCPPRNGSGVVLLEVSPFQTDVRNRISQEISEPKYESVQDCPTFERLSHSLDPFDNRWTDLVENSTAAVRTLDTWQSLESLRSHFVLARVAYVDHDCLAPSPMRRLNDRPRVPHMKLFFGLLLRAVQRFPHHEIGAENICDSHVQNGTRGVATLNSHHGPVR